MTKSTLDFLGLWIAQVPFAPLASWLWRKEKALAFLRAPGREGAEVTLDDSAGVPGVGDGSQVPGVKGVTQGRGPRLPGGHGGRGRAPLGHCPPARAALVRHSWNRLTGRGARSGAAAHTLHTDVPGWVLSTLGWDISTPTPPKEAGKEGHPWGEFDPVSGSGGCFCTEGTWRVRVRALSSLAELAFLTVLPVRSGGFCHVSS